MDNILGYCDGVIGESLNGWIANTTNPEALEAVLCWGSGQVRLPFSASFGRPDVCDALSLRGRFGFAIPVSALRSLGPVIRVTTMHGEELPGGSAICLPEPASPSPDGPAWAMLHIPRTAGTSLRNALMANFSPGEVLFIYSDGFAGISRQELSQLPFAQRAAARFVVGHTPFGVCRHLPKRTNYLSVLRAPLARLRSNYRHHVSRRTVFRRDGKYLSTAIAVQNGAVEEFDNIATRILSGATLEAVPIGAVSTDDVERAIHNIRTRFRFVALTEQLDEHYRALSRIMEIHAGGLPRENVGSIDDAATVDANVDWDRALHQNRFDTLLYQRVLADGLAGIDLAAQQ